ncbi:MAG: hypothetical protein KDB53_14205 [Planctomycetes bacterium]|nr:hypothetical protein [Planctomycetota bacterium]
MPPQDQPVLSDAGVVPRRKESGALNRSASSARLARFLAFALDVSREDPLGFQWLHALDL